MIIVYEPHWTGMVHVPSNSAVLQIVARAFPAQRVLMLGEATHLAELQHDPALRAAANITFRTVAMSPLYPGSPQIVSLARLRTEWRVLRQALAGVARGEPCLLVLLSTTATSLFLASWITRLRGARTGAIICLHGNLNEAIGWRSRNPLNRALDLHAGLLARHPGRVRLLVLEQGIRDELTRLLPAAARRVDVLPLPINAAEISEFSVPSFGAPIRIGLVGQATKAKGIDFFLATARDFRARYGDRVEFHLVGRVPPGTDLAPFSVLAHPVSTQPLPRADFNARLAKLHYVFLPLGAESYNLSASGAVVDAITWLKPIITTRVPIVTPLFDAYGDIGYLAADAAGMVAALEEILASMDAARYARQVAALERLRDSRTPDALVPVFRRLVQAAMPDVFAAAPTTSVVK